MFCDELPVSMLQLTHGGSSTIQAPVDLSPFDKLTQLDVKRIPPHWIVGLEKLKGRLSLIRVSRSINYLEVWLPSPPKHHLITFNFLTTPIFFLITDLTSYTMLSLSPSMPMPPPTPPLLICYSRR